MGHTLLLFISIYIYIYFLSSSHLLSPPFFYFSLLAVRPGVTQQALLPPPRYDSCLHFYREKTFSPVFPRRFASNCAYPRYALSAVCWSLICIFLIKYFLNTVGFELAESTLYSGNRGCHYTIGTTGSRSMLGGNIVVGRKGGGGQARQILEHICCYTVSYSKYRYIYIYVYLPALHRRLDSWEPTVPRLLNGGDGPLIVWETHH